MKEIFEKNIETLVTSKASDYQVVMFGEQHRGYRKDNDFVINILPEMKKQGFNYLALEIDKDPTGAPKMLADYISGKLSRDDVTEKLAELFPYIDGWLDIIDAAKKENIKIIRYDVSPEETISFNEREKKAFENLKELVFNEEPNAKLMIYCGAIHLNKTHMYSNKIRLFELLVCRSGKNKEKEYTLLAHHLDKHTHGNLLTVSLIGGITDNDPDLKDFDLTLDLEKGIVKHK